MSANQTELPPKNQKPNALQSLLAVGFLLVGLTANQIQVFGSDLVGKLLHSENAKTVDAKHQGAVAPAEDQNQAVNDEIKTIRHDFAQDISARRAASAGPLAAGAQDDEENFDPDEFTAKLDSSVENITGNMDALINDMNNIEQQVNQGTPTTRAQVSILADLIQQASQQKSSAAKFGTFQSYVTAEQEVIRLHAAASRVASVQM